MVEQPDLQQRIDSILTEHEFVPGDLADGCRCGWEGVWRAAHRAHVAAAVIADLGLKQERSWTSPPHNRPPDHVRIVTPWVRAEEEK